MNVFLGLLPLRHGILKKKEQAEELNVTHPIRYAKSFRNISIYYLE